MAAFTATLGELPAPEVTADRKLQGTDAAAAKKTMPIGAERTSVASGSGGSKSRQRASGSSGEGGDANGSGVPVTMLTTTSAPKFCWFRQKPRCCFCCEGSRARFSGLVLGVLLGRRVRFVSYFGCGRFKTSQAAPSPPNVRGVMAVRFHCQRSTVQSVQAIG